MDTYIGKNSAGDDIIIGPQVQELESHIQGTHILLHDFQLDELREGKVIVFEHDGRVYTISLLYAPRRGAG